MDKSQSARNVRFETIGVAEVCVSESLLGIWGTGKQAKQRGTAVRGPTAKKWVTKTFVGIVSCLLDDDG